MDRILVTDGETRAALAVVRSLGRAGYHVEVCASENPCLAGRSRFAAASHRISDPSHNPQGFVADLSRVGERSRLELLIPISDTSLHLLLPSGSGQFGMHVPFGPRHAYERLSDKLHVLRAARRLGLRVPETRVVWQACEIDETLAETAFEFPVIVKPHRSIVVSPEGIRKIGVSRVSGPGSLGRVLGELPSEAYPVLLQRVVEGPGTGVFMLTWNGRRLAFFGHRRMREKPPSGGVSVYREAIRPSPELLDRAGRLLVEEGWNGVSMVELKGEPGSGDAYVMEVNARFWGSLQLAVDAGVDFPLLLVEAARGGDVGETGDYRTGIRSRWWWGDVDQLLLRLRSGNGARRWTRRLKAVAEFLAHWPGRDRFEVFRPSDPRPFIHETRRWFGTLASVKSGRTREA